MIRVFKALIASSVLFNLCACMPDADSSASYEAVGVYEIVNKTGEEVVELYLYETGTDDKGDNYASGGFAPEEEIALSYGAASASIFLTIEFTTADGYNAYFDNLAIEEATINLLAEADVETGATPIEFPIG